MASNGSEAIVEHQVMAMPDRRSWLPSLLVCLAVGVTASILLRQDAGWDLRNYHLYNPFAFLHGRLWRDLMPAGPQSTFNPLLDVPYYVLALGPLAAWPRVMASVAGVPFGLLLFATWGLADWVLGDGDRPWSWFAVAIGGSAAATVSEIGTTFNDIPVAALVVGALAVGGPGCLPRPVVWRLCCAGAMVGAAVALKPTCAVLAPGVLIGLLVATPSWRARFVVAAAFGLGAVLLGGLFGGPWAFMLAQRFGSPTFPLMNGVFRSDWYPPRDFYDLRFLPRNALQAWLYPFWWIRLNASLVTELPFRDARFALAMMAVPVVICGAIRSRPAERRRALALLAAAAVGYVGWLRMFSILRYAVALEAFGGVLIMLAVRQLCGWWVSRLRFVAPAALLAGLLWHTQAPDWWRVPYGGRVFEVDAVALPPHSLVLTVGQPVAMLLPFLDAPDMRAVGITGVTLEARGYRLYDAMLDAIRAHDGPVFALVDQPGDLAMVPEAAGLVFDAAECRVIHTNITVGNTQVMLCPAKSLPERKACQESCVEGHTIAHEGALEDV